MTRITILLALLIAGFGNAHATPPSSDAVPAGRILLIGSSSCRWRRKGDADHRPARAHERHLYGDYRLKVFPYFFKSEKGRLAIVVSDESLAEVREGKVVAITGTPPPTAKRASAAIGAIATPVDIDHGTLKLWFTAGTRKMTFEPAYHFSVNEKILALAQADRMKP